MFKMNHGPTMIQQMQYGDELDIYIANYLFSISIEHHLHVIESTP
jgi:hypothetical protein